MISNIFTMSAYLEPFGGLNDFADTTFPQDWTVFYWAWWLAFAPTIGLFIARISRGRTVANMIIGALFFGSFGCAIFFMILGNYGLHLQLTGQVDVISILKSESQYAAIFAILGSLPMKWMVISLYTILAVVFLSTTFDSISYILASVVQKQVEDEPLRWNRLFWAGALSLMPITILFIDDGGLSSIQTLSIVAGLPLILISLLLCISIYRIGHYDINHQSHVDDTVIDVTNMPDHDPRHPNGSWDG